MACRGCSDPAKPPGETRTFTFPLNGVYLELTVTGTFTAANLPLVQQCLEFSFHAFEGMQQEPEPAPREARTALSDAFRKDSRS